MKPENRRAVHRAILALFLLAFAAVALTAGEPAPVNRPELRQAAQKNHKDGNWAEAYEKFHTLLLAAPDAAAGAEREVYDDLYKAINCLARLNRLSEFDALLEDVVKARAGEWRALHAAAQRYADANHWGFLVAGEYTRGHHRGGGRWVSSEERDRVRAMQLMEAALKAAKGEQDTQEVGSFYFEFAGFLQQFRAHNMSWRLQVLTDLSTLPDYEEGRYYGGASSGAPVDGAGDPVYYRLPKTWEEATNDGERWRYLLMNSVELNPNLKANATWAFATFLHQQFGVQTMAEYWPSLFGRGAETEEGKAETGPFAVQTLGEQETIAKLAGGVKRFQLPDEYNYIRLFRQLAEEKGDYWDNALDMLGSIFENRRQYDKAVECWTAHGDRQNRIDQILMPWGVFEPVMTQPAESGATVEYRFRNGGRVDFVARRIKVRELLDDVKAYIETNRTKEWDWHKADVSQIGWRLVQNNETKYVGDEAARWSLDLQPRPNHFDKRMTVTTPLQQAGAYLLEGQMKDGNVSRIILWLDDTAIIKKPMADGNLLYVADAVSGSPVAKAHVEFFGFRRKWRNKLLGYQTRIDRFAEFTSADGLIRLQHPGSRQQQVTQQRDDAPAAAGTAEKTAPNEPAAMSEADLDNDLQWLIIATTEEGRFAYLGFTGVWYPNYYDQEYNATKVLAITDRPVYRPKQTVHWKLWVRHAKYDQEDVSAFAKQRFEVRIHNPKGDEVMKSVFQADEYGGLSGDFELPGDATLGVYQLSIPHHGGGTFRVEEYKKPEFEVSVEAPTEPVMLGEKVTAKVEAKYYFGSPVTEAKVHYKVLRYTHNASWYPVMPWDWFYGRGYWWFAYDYEWYPGWARWGCLRPRPWWWPKRQTPPELVAEAEMEIGPEGKLEIPVDTALAKELHGDLDHRYEITVEVTDASRRTITGTGSVLVARTPFKVYTWVDRGHYRVGDTVRASFQAQTLDQKPVEGKGKLVLYRVSYDKERKPVETEAQRWNLDTNAEGRAEQQLVASRAGQYRLSYTLRDAQGHEIEGGYVFTARGEGRDRGQYRFQALELIPDKTEYAPGETVKLQINTDRTDATVLLFVRPANGVCLPPKILRLKGQSAVEEILVSKRDMPNFFVEALTVAGGKVHSETREIVAPPEKRVLNVEVATSKAEYLPGEEASLTVKLTDLEGKPFIGSTVLSLYDKSVEYISGGSNVPEIKEFFWKWRRHHHPQTESSLERWFQNLLKQDETPMQDLGVFGHMIADEVVDEPGQLINKVGFVRSNVSKAIGNRQMTGYSGGAVGAIGRDTVALPAATPMSDERREASKLGVKGEEAADAGGGAGGAAAEAEATVRKEFADTAYWNAALSTGPDGTATVTAKMPENLTAWKAKVWAMGHGTKVGEGSAEAVTRKNLILRLQAPRFFVEKDEVVLSANIHNYLAADKEVKAVLELEGGALVPLVPDKAKGLVPVAAEADGVYRVAKTVTVKAGGETRVDWRVRAAAEGEAVVRMKALTDEESDAMEQRFPVHVHGMDKMVPQCGVIRPDETTARFTLEVPAERRINASRLEIRYSPTLAMAMVDALPYLTEYPYGCTEQTLNRFLPAVLTQRILQKMKVDLAAVREAKSNLNAQELGPDRDRAAQWRQEREWTHDIDGNIIPYNPVYDEAEVGRMVKYGVKRLSAMQCADGGWGWFSGYGEHSYPHTTATVVHGLQIAQANEVALLPGVLEQGVEWLKNFQQQEIRELQRYEKTQGKRGKARADSLDAFAYMVLADAGVEFTEMREYLYRDRNDLPVYAKALYGLGLQKRGQAEKLAMILRNIGQYVVEDDENQTAYLNLGNGDYWWCWYGSEYEAHAYYLKLLAAAEPQSRVASRMVKYLLNNRKHATYWNSTRDTAVCLEAFADYIQATGEDRPDMTVEIRIDGKKQKEVKIDAANLFAYDNKLVLFGDAVETGTHTVEVVKTGAGPLYVNAYLSYFTLEDFIPKAGLEVKVERAVYRLQRKDKAVDVAGARGQAIKQQAEAYERVLLASEAELASGDLVEIELTLESKNDYEYLLFEDMKAAGFEPVEIRSGYNGNDLGAYVEFRDERVAFFVHRLARGKHSVSYRLRAETPGRFSALPARASAMYAPELRANSDEIKLRIRD